MIRVQVEKKNIWIDHSPQLVANCAGFDKVQFSFDGMWDGLIKTIVFTNGDVTRAVLLPIRGPSDKPIIIPRKVLKAGNLYISAVGIKKNGEKILKLSTKKMNTPLRVRESGSHPPEVCAGH